MRLGVGIPWQHAERDPTWYTRALTQLTPAWWYNWKNDINDAAYIPMIHTLDNTAQMPAGEDRLWLLGNEPERSKASGGSDTAPNEFADNVSAFISANPMAEVALPGILLGNDGYRWLDQYLDAYGFEPDLWHVHIYAWSPLHWQDQWQQWQEYLRDNGLGRKTIVSECGGWGQDLNNQKGIMHRIRRALWEDGNLVDAAWFSAHYSTYDSRWAGTDLLDAGGNFTQLGAHFAGIQPAQAEHTVYLPEVSA